MRANARRYAAVECAAPFERPDAVKAQYAFQWPFISGHGRMKIGRPQLEMAAFSAPRQKAPPPPAGDARVRRAEVVVPLAVRDRERRDRLVRVRPAAGGGEADHRHRAVRGEVRGEPGAPAPALAPAQ